MSRRRWVIFFCGFALVALSTYVGVTLIPLDALHPFYRDHWFLILCVAYPVGWLIAEVQR